MWAVGDGRRVTSNTAVAALEERSGSGGAKLEVPDQQLHALPEPWSGYPLLTGSPLPWQGPASGNRRRDTGWWRNGQQEIGWWQRTAGGGGTVRGADEGIEILCCCEDTVGCYISHKDNCHFEKQRFALSMEACALSVESRVKKENIVFIMLQGHNPVGKNQARRAFVL